MSQKEPKLKRDMIGKKVESLRDFKNGYGFLPEGTEYLVIGAHGGLTLASEECPCCRFKLSISKVPYKDVRWLT